MAELLGQDPVLLHASLRPNELACIDLGINRRWTYLELDSDIQRATAVLATYGIRIGDRLATISANNVYQVILQQALMRLGAIHVPLNWRLVQPELAKLLEDCSPTLLFTDLEPPDLPPGCRHVLFSSFCAAVESAEAGNRLDPRPRYDTSIILYTSGTSGSPKGVMLTARSIVATTNDFSIMNEVDASSVFLCDGPMFHIMGLVLQTWPPLMSGGTLIVSPKFNPETTNTLLSDPDFHVTHYLCVPQMAEALARASNFDPSAWLTLKALFTGGAPNHPSRIKWWLGHGIRMVDGYGSTETGTISGMPLSSKLIHSKAGSVGLPALSTAVRVVDDHDQPVPTGCAARFSFPVRASRLDIGKLLTRLAPHLLMMAGSAQEISDVSMKTASSS